MDVSCTGGNAVVQSPGGAAPVQLCHTGGPVERGLHLRRDVQEKVSETSLSVHQAAILIFAGNTQGSLVGYGHVYQSIMHLGLFPQVKEHGCVCVGNLLGSLVRRLNGL